MSQQKLKNLAVKQSILGVLSSVMSFKVLEKSWYEIDALSELLISLGTLVPKDKSSKFKMPLLELKKDE